MSDFRLIKKLGLNVTTVFTGASRIDDMVLADELEALLENGVRVWGYIGEHGSQWNSDEPRLTRTHDIYTDVNGTAFCEHCSAPLVATWAEAKETP